jgi:hypothetical protein
MTGYGQHNREARISLFAIFRSALGTPSILPNGYQGHLPLYQSGHSFKQTPLSPYGEWRRLDNPGSIHGRDRIFSLYHIQTKSDSNQPPTQTLPGAPSRMVNCPQLQANLSSPSGAKVKNAWSFKSAVLHLRGVAFTMVSMD